LQPFMPKTKAMVAASIVESIVDDADAGA